MSVRIITADVMDGLAQLADESVHCVVTSPPYWGLRDYGVAGQIGLEPTPEAYVARIAEVFREVRRVLRDDGTLWLNLGDSYVANRGNTLEKPGHDNKAVHESLQVRKFKIPGKPKDLVGIPWRVAFALQADGWYLRQDIVWSKPNPMPESVRDRCTKAHEYLFLLAKSERYYFDFAAMQEPSSDNTHARLPGNVRPAKSAQAYLDGAGEHRTKAGLHEYAERQRAKWKTPDGWDTSKGEGGHGSFHKDGREKGRKLAEAGSGVKNNDSMDAALAVMPETRNKRSVWTVATQPFKEAHFATFPPALIEPCVGAGCPEGGMVLDPFGGAGTTGLVADRMQRNAVLIELNPAYATMARERINADAPLFTETI